MNLADFHAGLSILIRYYIDCENQPLTIYRNEIWLNVTDWEVKTGDLMELIRLGWTQPESDPLTMENYDPKDYWRAKNLNIE